MAYFEINQQTGATDVIADALPPITGTEKQIAWATDLRLQKAQKLANDFDNKFHAIMLAGKVKPEQHSEFMARWAETQTDELSNTDARHWIDRRG